MKNLFLILVVVSLSGYGQTATDYFNKGISKFNLKDYQGAISEFNKSIHCHSTKKKTKKYQLQYVPKVSFSYHHSTSYAGVHAAQPLWGRLRR